MSKNKADEPTSNQLALVKQALHNELQGKKPLVYKSNVLVTLANWIVKQDAIRRERVEVYNLALSGHLFEEYYFHQKEGLTDTLRLIGMNTKQINTLLG